MPARAIAAWTLLAHRAHAIHLMQHCRCVQDMYAEVPVPASLEGSKSFDFLRRDLRRAGSLDGGAAYDRSVYGGGYDRSVHSGGASPAAGAYGSIYGGSHSGGSAGACLAVPSTARELASRSCSCVHSWLV